MRSWICQFKVLMRSEDGPTATEYAVLLAVIAISVMSAMALFGERVNDIYLALNQTLNVF